MAPFSFHGMVAFRLVTDISVVIISRFHQIVFSFPCSCYGKVADNWIEIGP